MLNIFRVRHVFFLFCVFEATLTFSQIKIEGAIYNEYLEPFNKASVKIENGKVFKSDAEGNVIVIIPKLPQKIIVSHDAFSTEKIILKKGENKFNVVLKESLAIDDIVISASRTPERIIESPVDVLRLGEKQIKTSIGSAYKSLAYLPGVQQINNYNSFNSINTRGFAKFDNNRFVTIVDGMDMAIPASFLNQGDFGLPIDLDLQSIEILPGAASALYGANAYNGLMLISTKSPFDFTGINVKLSSGGVSQTKGISSYEVSIRNAYRFSESFAAKATFSYETGEQWRAEDYRNINSQTGKVNDNLIYQDIAFNGVNVYGDESIISGFLSEAKRTIMFSRSGFSENQLLRDTFKNKSIKFNSSLNFRPFEDKSLEFVLANNISLSDKIVHENVSRYVLNNFYMLKSKFEFKGDNFFLRFNYSADKTRNAYDLKRLGYSLNEKLFDLKLFGSNFTSFVNRAHMTLPEDQIDYSEIRRKTDNYFYETGSKYNAIPRSEYFKFLSDINSKLITQELGSAIYDNSKYINIEGNYNFRELINNFMDFQLGGAYKKYNTNSKGTLFNDFENPIVLGEYGFYTQLQKKIFNQRLKITGSLRYDKNELFKHQISPRFAFNYMLGENKNHAFRLSCQTGYRNPNIQELYTNRKLEAYTGVIGSASDNNFGLHSEVSSFLKHRGFSYINRGHSLNFKKYSEVGYKAEPVTLDDILNNSFLGFPYRTPKNERTSYIKNMDYKRVKPESIRTYEFGYRSLLSLNYSTNLDFRFSAYYNVHNNFISLVSLTTPLFGKVFPAGEKLFTPKEINVIKARFGDARPLTFQPKKGDDRRQYVLSDVNQVATDVPGQYKETQMYTNMKSEVSSYGFNVGCKTNLYNKIDLGINYSFMDYRLEDKDGGLFDPAFNTPKHTVKTRFGAKLIGNLKTELGFIWSDSYFWNSNFASAEIPQRTLVDGELNYKMPSLKSIIKLGVRNLLNEEYSIAPGAGSIGSTYYLSWIIKN